MRNKLYLLIVLPWILSSCHLYHYQSQVAYKDPAVIMKDGTKIEAESVEHVYGFLKDRIVVNDTESIKSKLVAFYFTGSNNYANVGRKDFASQVISGKINMYRIFKHTTYTTTSATGATYVHSGTSVYYYIQEEDKKDVHFLNYHHLRPMIEPNTPSFEYLKHLNTNKNISNVMLYGGLAALFGGLAMTINHQLKNNVDGVGPGPLVMFAGTGLCITGKISKIVNYTKLFKVIEMRNKE